MKRIYNETLYNKLLIWFRDNIYNITDFCFSKGLAKNKEDWADIVWYKNELGENSVDKMFLISEIRSKVIEKLDLIEYGNIHGGTTIQLPFGFVQWHSPQKTFPGCLQFHHSYDKIQNIADSF